MKRFFIINLLVAVALAIVVYSILKINNLLEDGSLSFTLCGVYLGYSLSLLIIDFFGFFPDTPADKLQKTKNLSVLFFDLFAFAVIVTAIYELTAKWIVPCLIVAFLNGIGMLFYVSKYVIKVAPEKEQEQND